MNNEDKILVLLSAIQQEQKEQRAFFTQKISDIEEVLDKTAIIQENEVLPKIDLCLESQVGILDKMEELAPLSRLRETEMDVSTLKNIVKEHSKKLKAIS